MDSKKIKIAIGSDHAGYPLKQPLYELLLEEGYNIKDFGTYSLDSVDYPDIAKEVSTQIVDGNYDLGILICGTGIGVSITANKIKGIRAGACSDTFSAKMARAHNNANIIAFGSRVVGLGLAYEIAEAFLNTEFESGSRHEKRVNKINALDSC